MVTGCVSLRCLGSVLALLALAGCTSSTAPSGPLKVGAVYPLTGNQGQGLEQADGVRLAAELVNRDGGVHGREVQVVAQDAPDPRTAVSAVDGLVDRGISIILGTYATGQAMPASAEASKRGAVFLETGALADSLTMRGLPGVLRSSVDAGTLGRNAAQFVHDFVLPRSGIALSTGRVAIVFENDAYGSSVAYSAVAGGDPLGLNIVDAIGYDPARVNYDQLATTLGQDRPDVLIAAPYLQDAVALRLALVRHHVKVKTIVGASSAYSGPEFGKTLGAAAVGLFATDKSDGGTEDAGLLPATRDLLHRASALYLGEHGKAMSSYAVAGFVGGWVMFHDILPRSQSTGRDAVWRAAMTVDLPAGSEINGSGVKFATAAAPNAGQNTRALGVIWEWLGVNQRAVVFPAPFSSTEPRILPVSS
ncbi:MAG: ABC transporter substrate-binding protein [Candidatus Dormibacteria bacterium]